MSIKQVVVRRNRVRLSVVVAVLAIGSLAFTLPGNAGSPPPPIAVEPVTPRAAFVDDVDLQVRTKAAGERTEVRNLNDPSLVVTAKITVQPNGRFPWHVHPGPVMVTIATGNLTYVDGDDCSERVYRAGEAFFDVGDHVHSAYNAGTEPMVFYATWYDAPATGPLTIPVEDAPACS